MRTYHEERFRLFDGMTTGRIRREQKLDEAKRGIDQLVDALAGGLTILDRLLALETEKVQLKSSLLSHNPQLK